MLSSFSPRPRKRILVVDDEPLMRKGLELQLKNAGYEVDTVEDGRQALLLLRERSYDLVISDIIMPFISGLELLNSLRKEQNNTAILLCSSLNSENVVRRAFEIGADGFISKPYHTRELLQHIDSILIETEHRKVQSGQS
ncbi:response regulator [bacterium]|nr:response regulator [bacterium]